MKLVKQATRQATIAAITMFTGSFGGFQIAAAADIYHVRSQLTVATFNTVFTFVGRFLLFVGEGLARGSDVVTAPAQAASEKRSEIKEAAATEAQK